MMNKEASFPVEIERYRPQRGRWSGLRVLLQEHALAQYAVTGTFYRTYYASGRRAAFLPK